MAINRKISTDRDFQELIERGGRIRVFQDNHIVENSSTVIRFDDDLVVTQSSLSDLTYHKRNECEFFELRKR